MADQSQFNLENFKPPNISAKLVRNVVVILLLVFFFFSSWFTVSPEEVGVILRFGEFSRTVDPGLNFKIPFGIESVIKVPVERQLKQEFGFRTLQAGVRTPL